MTKMAKKEYIELFKTDVKQLGLEEVVATIGWASVETLELLEELIIRLRKLESRMLALSGNHAKYEQ